jgi:hypothetical protein
MSISTKEWLELETKLKEKRDLVRRFICGACASVNPELFTEAGLLEHVATCHPEMRVQHYPNFVFDLHTISEIAVATFRPI